MVDISGVGTNPAVILTTSTPAGGTSGTSQSTEAAAPLYSSLFSARNSAGALGLSSPSNYGDIEASFAEISFALEKLSSKLRADEEVSKTERQLTELRGALSVINALTNIATAIVSNLGRIADNFARIGDLQAERAPLAAEQTRLNDLKAGKNARIGDINTRIAQIDGALPGLIAGNKDGVNNGTIAALNSERAGLINERGRLEGEIGGIDAQLAPINNRIGQIDAEIGGLNATNARLAQENLDNIEALANLLISDLYLFALGLLPGLGNNSDTVTATGDNRTEFALEDKFEDILSNLLETGDRDLQDVQIRSAQLERLGLDPTRAAAAEDFLQSVAASLGLLAAGLQAALDNPLGLPQTPAQLAEQSIERIRVTV